MGPNVLRTQTYEEILPLVEDCKAGRLFAVQDWIARGKPVNPPEAPASGRMRKRPLEYAIESGFHSLVEVLVDGGAVLQEISPANELRFCALSAAVQQRRFDMVTSLVARGADPSEMDMARVFDAWDPDMMRYFIDAGADVETDNPLAYALTCRIRTAVGIFKQYRNKIPSFQEQGNIALRYHCSDGNLKWVSLLLWAGADPYACGEDDYSREPYPGEVGLSALEYAASRGKFEVFEIRQLRLDVSRPELGEIMYYAYKEGGYALLERFLNEGMQPNNLPTGGCEALRTLLSGIDFDFSAFSFWSNEKKNRDIDCADSRRKLDVVGLLLRHGARWIPADRDEIKSVRRSLLKMKPEYTIQFVNWLAEYNSCTRGTAEELLRSSTLHGVLGGKVHPLEKLARRLPESL